MRILNEPLTRKETKKLNRVLAPVNRKYGLDFGGNKTATAEAIGLLESAIQTNPEEWVFWYEIGSLYSDVGELAQAVRAAQKCCSMRPEDRHSIFALASNFNLLTHAKYIDSPLLGELRDYMEQFPFADPETGKKALQDLGMTLEYAAEMTIYLFNKIVQADVDDPYLFLSIDALSNLCSEYPQIAKKYYVDENCIRRIIEKRLLGLYTSFIPTEIVNTYDKAVFMLYVLDEAMELERRLFLPVSAYCFCQQAIAEEPNDGDAWIMLAEGLYHLSLAMLMNQAISTGLFCMKKSAAVMGHWLKTKPPTHPTNNERGMEVEKRIRDIYRRVISDIEGRSVTEQEINELFDYEAENGFLTVIKPSLLMLLIKWCIEISSA